MVLLIYENLISRCDGIGRRSGLKIHRWRQRTGSSPVTGTKNKYRGVEQLVARRAHNPKVVGSNPAPATNWKKRVSGFLELFFLC